MSVNKISVLLRQSSDGLYAELEKIATRLDVPVSHVVKAAALMYLEQDKIYMDSAYIELDKKIQQAKELEIAEIMALSPVFTREKAIETMNITDSWTQRLVS